MKEKKHFETIAIHSETKHWSKSRTITSAIERVHFLGNNTKIVKVNYPRLKTPKNHDSAA